MTTKLTLTIDDSVIKRAKHYAKHSGKSVSQIVEQYLNELTTDKSTHQISPKLQQLVGAIQLPKDFNEEEDLRNYLESKHL